MRWPIVLGVAGFVAGFFGPMIFSPDANQGPLVGIFISGPAGVAIGLLLYGGCSLLGVSACDQWRLLSGAAAVGVATTLLLVLPSAALQGSLFAGEVTSCATPASSSAETLAYWDQRIAAVNWAPPRDGWRPQMEADLRAAPGVVADVRVKRVNAVYEKRKPWNRGTLLSAGWIAKPEERSFYLPTGSCADFPVQGEFDGFLDYAYGGKIDPPDIWPPRALAQVINASVFSAVPARFASFK